MRNLVIPLSIIFLALILVVLSAYKRTPEVSIAHAFTGNYTVAEIVELYSKSVTRRLKPYFDKAGVTYPPTRITLLVIKAEKALELWASDGSVFRYIHTYEIKKTSGNSGPKLREGDKQVPEGIYRIVGLNPNSAYHLSMKLNYPNEFDLLQAHREGRIEPGSNIFIHGKAYSSGCLAMGDPAIEELFVLTDRVGIENVSVVIAPTDPRKKRLQPDLSSPAWVDDLYLDIEAQFSRYRPIDYTNDESLDSYP